MPDGHLELFGPYGAHGAGFSVVVAKPRNLSFTEAAAIPFGGITALIFLRKG
jgi:NADPH:quinone reductase-like Zn-dependent oxidoreductase